MGDRLVVGADRRLEAQLRALAERRMVLFAGLPGTGKSLLVQQLAHLASAAGRRVHLLQWDVARPVFEACPAGRRYPLADGVTHVVVRKAAGVWVRDAIARWNDAHPAADHLLVGEAPFVGGRFIELARRIDDRAEPLLAAPSCRFALSVPSADVRRFLEARRERRTASPLHPREREDAPPALLREIWGSLGEVARRLGLAVSGGDDDPALYRGVYQALLRHRNLEIVPLDVILPTESMSVYDFAVTPPSLVPTETEAGAFIAEVERRYPDPTVLERELERWWRV
jgi:hypothetical protein